MQNGGGLLVISNKTNTGLLRHGELGPAFLRYLQLLEVYPFKFHFGCSYREERAELEDGGWQKRELWTCRAQHGTARGCLRGLGMACLPAGCPWVPAGPSRLHTGPWLSWGSPAHATCAGSALGGPRQVSFSKHEEKLLFSASFRVFLYLLLCPISASFSLLLFFSRNHSI